MTALVSVETVLLVLLVVLVAGLLRSHAEILRRLGAGASGSRARAGSAGVAAARRATPARRSCARAAIAARLRTGDAIDARVRRRRPRGRRCSRS